MIDIPEQNKTWEPSIKVRWRVPTTGRLGREPRLEQLHTCTETNERRWIEVPTIITNETNE